MKAKLAFGFATLLCLLAAAPAAAWEWIYGPAAAIAQVYPGGVSALEQNWHAWLGESRKDHVW